MTDVTSSAQHSVYLLTVSHAHSSDVTDQSQQKLPDYCADVFIETQWSFVYTAGQLSLH